jgi:oligopeptide/dipeptide ABC transporter ATP-binding protein
LLWITHDLSVIAGLADRIAVMYAGRIVEQGPVREIFQRPAHPYTQGLLRALPRIDSGATRLDLIPGQPPSMSALPAGCRFEPRCPYAVERCRQEYPDWFEAADGSRRSACWRTEEVLA